MSPFAVLLAPALFGIAVLVAVGLMWLAEKDV